MNKEDLHKTLKEMMSNKTFDKEDYLISNGFSVNPHWEVDSNNNYNENSDYDLIVKWISNFETDVESNCKELILFDTKDDAAKYINEPNIYEYFRCVKVEIDIAKLSCKKSMRKLNDKTLSNNQFGFLMLLV